MPALEENPALAGLGLTDPVTGEQVRTEQQYDSDWVTATDERANAADSGLTQDQSSWDSDQNPWKQKHQELAQQVQSQTPDIATVLDQRKGQLQSWAAQAWEQAVQGGVDKEVATLIIGTKLSEQLAQEELKATKAATLPHVRRGAAE